MHSTSLTDIQEKKDVLLYSVYGVSYGYRYRTKKWFYSS